MIYGRWVDEYIHLNAQVRFTLALKLMTYRCPQILCKLLQRLNLSLLQQEQGERIYFGLCFQSLLFRVLTSIDLGPIGTQNMTCGIQEVETGCESIKDKV